jgi:acyl-CoA synthetase (NDP forming)
MAKLTKEYFSDNEVLILGFPLTDDPSMTMILQGFADNNIKVYAVNEAASGQYAVKVYKGLSELPKVPQCAYIWLEKNEITPWIDRLVAAGVRRVLFHSKKDVEQADVEACKNAGLETAIACPMMLLGKGIHKFHKLLAGV